MILTINGIQAALKKGSSIEYVSENRLFTDADDYSMEIELPLADCPRNLGIFGHLTRKDVDMGDIFFDAVLQDTNFIKRGAVVITGISNESVKVQFHERRSYQNFFPRFDETYIDELDYAQRTNTIGSLKSADVSRSITAPMALAQSQPQVIIQENKELKEIIARLNERLDEPFVIVNTVTGDMGIKQAQDEYQRLMNNKTPKNKRK
jgi:hypothetical protein